MVGCMLSFGLEPIVYTEDNAWLQGVTFLNQKGGGLGLRDLELQGSSKNKIGVASNPLCSSDLFVSAPILCPF